MRTFFRIVTILILSVLAQSIFAQSYVPGEVIVKIKGANAALGGGRFIRSAVREKGLTVQHHWSKLHMYHMSLPAGQSVEAAIQDLKLHADVEYVEPNYLIKKASNGGILQVFSAEEMQAASQSNEVLATGADIGLSQIYQQQLQQQEQQGVSAQSVGQVQELSLRPIVAVIDTGLDITHYVMQDTHAVWTNPGEIAANGIDDDGNGYIDDVNGWNFVTNSGNMYDDDGHGTHVSGIILSVDQNIFLPANQLKTAKIQIMPLKFLDGNGSGSTSNAIKAIYYAIDNGAVVLNNSWGGTDYSSALNEAVAYSYNAGASFVAAAGNAGSNNDATPMYPSNYDVPNVIAAAAITDSYILASFSNYGASTVALGSPGVYISSTLPGNSFGTMSGTSMATPFVSGTAGQMKAGAPGMLGYQIKSLLISQAIGEPGLHTRVISNGMLNISNSVVAAKSATVSTTQPAYTLSYQPDRALASSLSGGCGTVTKLSVGEPPESGLGAVATCFVLMLAPLMYIVYRRVKNPLHRRQFERFRIQSEVRIHVGDRELVGSVSSISLGGVQVNTSALMQDGGLVTLSIASPDGRDQIEVAGRVVWSDVNKAYGVAFDHTPQSVLSSISQWTKSLKPA
jgi:hypothetical protein